MSDAWTGAWRWVTDAADGRPTILSNRYCFMAVAREREPVTSKNPSDAELARLFRGVLGAGAGVVETPVDGDPLLQYNSNIVGLYPKNVSSRVLRSTLADGDSLRSQVLGPDREVLADYSYTRISGAGTSELAGSWEIGDSGFSGLVLFTDSQYQYLVTADDRPEDSTNESPDAVLAGLYRSTFGQAGAYRVEGDTLVATPDIVIDPASRNVPTSIPFNLDRERLELEIGGRAWSLGRVVG